LAANSVMDTVLGSAQPTEKALGLGETAASQRRGREHRRGADEQMEAGRRLAGLAFRGILLVGQEFPLPPGDDGDPAIGSRD